MFSLAVLGGLGIGAARGLTHVAAQQPGPRGGAPVGLRWWWVAVAALALQLYLVLGPGADAPPATRTALIWLTHVGVAGVALANRRMPWMWLVAAGLLLNLAVMTANGGLMPVSPETLERAGIGHVRAWAPVGAPQPRSKDVILPTEHTRLAFLSDVLVVPWRRGAFSVGDVVIAVGALLTLQHAVAVTFTPGVGLARRQ